MFRSTRGHAASIRQATARLCRLHSLEERLGLSALALACLLALCQDALAHEFKAGTIEILHPHTPAPPPGAKVAAGYFVLKNEGETADRLVSVTGEIAPTAQIHEMAVNDGIMTMREVAGGVEIPAGGEVALKPGSYHIMFMNLERPLHVGEKFKGTLTFEKAGSVDVEYAVEPMGEDHGEHGK